MVLDRTYVEETSAQTSFTIETTEKVLRLLEVLGDVGKHPLLSHVLALKCGTALNLFYGPPPRMSVDLDFNFIGAVDRAGMESARPDVERAIGHMAEARGYRVQLSKPAHAGRTYFLSYRSVTWLVSQRLMMGHGRYLEPVR